jgi:hypothetical protein
LTEPVKVVSSTRYPTQWTKSFRMSSFIAN